MEKEAHVDQKKRSTLTINPGICGRKQARGWIPHGNREDLDRQNKEQGSQKLYAKTGSCCDLKTQIGRDTRSVRTNKTIRQLQS